MGNTGHGVVKFSSISGTSPTDAVQKGWLNRPLFMIENDKHSVLWTLLANTNCDWHGALRHNWTGSGWFYHSDPTLLSLPTTTDPQLIKCRNYEYIERANKQTVYIAQMTWFKRLRRWSKIWSSYDQVTQHWCFLRLHRVDHFQSEHTFNVQIHMTLFLPVMTELVHQTRIIMELAVISCPAPCNTCSGKLSRVDT